MEPENQHNNDSTDVSPVNNEMVTATAVHNQTSVPRTDAATAGLPPAKEKKRIGKKAGLIAGIVIAVIALTGSAAAYQFWYQNPDKVMADALSHLVASKQGQITGDIVVDSEEVRVNVALKVNGNEQDSSMSADVVITPKTEETKFLGDIKLGADAIVASNGDFYFKIKDLKPVVDDIIDAAIDMQVDAQEEQGYEIDQDELSRQRIEISKSVDPIMAKIDNKWIKVTADDLEQEGDDEQACILDAAEKVNDDDAMRKELIDTYKEHKFVLVDKELGIKNDAIGYQLAIDEAAAKAFGEAIEDTSFGKELKKCDQNIFEDTSDTVAPVTDDTTEVKTEVWITRWSHQLKSLKMTVNDSDDKTTGEIDLDFVVGTSDEVALPSDATSITELQAEISELMSGAVGVPSLSA